MASRKDQKEKLRAERLEREQTAAAAAARKRRLGYVVAGVLVAAVVVAIAAIALSSGGDDKSPGNAKASGDWPSGSIPARKITDLAAAAKAANCKILSPKCFGQGHTTKKQVYKTNPPSSGAHDPTPAHDQAFLKNPGDEHLVHALEHGRVVYWFNPSASDEIRGDLKKL